MRQKSSIYKGISKFRDRWRVRYKNKTIGYADTEKEGADMYNFFADKGNQLSPIIKCSFCLCHCKKEDFYTIGRGINQITSYCKLCSNIVQVLYENNLPKTEESVAFALMVITLHRIKYNLLNIDEARIFYTYNRQIYREETLYDKRQSIRDNSVS